MDSSNIKLQGNSIPELKQEIAKHLDRALVRVPKDKTLTSYKIPMGFGCTIEAGERYSVTYPFGITGSLADFMSFLPPSTRDCWIKVTVSNSGITQQTEQRLQDDYRNYSIQLNVPRLSVVKIELDNRSKIAIEAVVGFTFQERRSDEIRTTELIGNI